jgi:hypothetical protein
MDNTDKPLSADDSSEGAENTRQLPAVAPPTIPDATFQVMSRKDARKSPMPSEENPSFKMRAHPLKETPKFTRPAHRNS